MRSILVRALRTYDVVVYGCTPAAITTAIQVNSMGKTAAIVCPGAHLGGVTTSGLGWTDTKYTEKIGGLARKFYSGIYDYYNTNNPDVWFAQTRGQYMSAVPKWQDGPPIDTKNDLQWTFEPKVASKVFADMLDAAAVTVYHDEYLDRGYGGVSMNQNTITQFRTLAGNIYSAKQFIDATYEGDLMAAIGIPFMIGRDSKKEFGESLGGRSLGMDKFTSPYIGIDPYVTPGDSSSGLLPGVSDIISNDTASDPQWGSADPLRIQCATFRLTLTKQNGNKNKFARPPGYKVSDYELLLRIVEKGNGPGFNVKQMPNKKTDCNNEGKYGVSLDYVGGAYNVATGNNWATASYSERAAMYEAHKNYEMGLLYTIANSDRVPAATRQSIGTYGLATDEYTDNGNWPYTLYMREGRRMRGRRILQQQDVEAASSCDRGNVVVGFITYSLDSHSVRRVLQGDTIVDEGPFYRALSQPAPIPYESMLPWSNDAVNFINPITLSATHVAYGGVRMEPTFMVLGQSAAIAAVHAIDEGCNVQDIDRVRFRQALADAGQITG